MSLFSEQALVANSSYTIPFSSCPTSKFVSVIIFNENQPNSEHEICTICSASQLMYSCFNWRAIVRRIPAINSKHSLARAVMWYMLTRTFATRSKQSQRAFADFGALRSVELKGGAFLQNGLVCLGRRVLQVNGCFPLQLFSDLPVRSCSLPVWRLRFYRNTFDPRGPESEHLHFEGLRHFRQTEALVCQPRNGQSHPFGSPRVALFPGAQRKTPGLHPHFLEIPDP